MKNVKNSEETILKVIHPTVADLLGTFLMYSCMHKTRTQFLTNHIEINLNWQKMSWEVHSRIIQNIPTSPKVASY